MKCIVCGNELKKPQRKYCCKKCAQIAYLSGMSQPMVNNEKQVRELWVYFKRSFDIKSDRFGSLSVWKLRVFVCACLEMGYNINSISRGIKKHHSVILYHKKRALENEKKLASDFLKDSKKYIYINDLKPKKIIYPEGFHY